ncbi:MAG: PEP-utilizing enzyme [Candidatus Roizmanbacteria bacterium]|nr:PEP-utilizing enzyme [Candidatus Roizmanbacteria bacterium]MCR4313054.1 PEP-utilizing enzyme [Candidatus Roizmanbacteria bacterium]
MLINKLLLKGTPASVGIVEGIVKVVNNPFYPNFNKGDILVTEMTDPRFIQLMKKSSAVITDIGGQLCHAAITAREFMIPCIVGTKNGTIILKNGQKILVNADEGKIYASE